MPENLGIRYILLATFFFTMMNIGVKMLSNLPTAQVVLFRAVVALLICYVTLKREKIDYRGKNRPLLLLRGLMGTIALILYFYTLQNMPLATAVSLQKLSPVFSVLIAFLLLKEKPGLIQIFCLFLSFAGVLVIKGFANGIPLFLLIIGVVSAIFSSLAYNFVRKLKDFDHPLVVVFYFPLVTIPIISPFALSNWVWPKPQEWLLLGLIGIMTQIGQVYLTKAYQHSEVSAISVYNYLDIVFALIIGLLLFGEKIDFYSFAGVLMIAGGSILNTLFLRKN